MEGWIKLHRKMLEWQWIKEPKMVQLFVYLLLRASNEKSTQDGIVLNAGQIKTNLSVIEKFLKLSQREVRTILDKLSNSGEISVVGYERKYIIITISNFQIYQSKKERKTQQKTPINNNEPNSYNNENNEQRHSTQPDTATTRDTENTNAIDSLLNSFDNNFKIKDTVCDTTCDTVTPNHTLYIKEVKEKIDKKDSKSLSFGEKLNFEKIIVRENVALTPSQIESVENRMGGEAGANLVYDILMAWKIKKRLTLQNDREEDFGRILQWCYKEADKQLVESKIMTKNGLKISEGEIRTRKPKIIRD